jgi:low affinity Fe/Cu permease
MPDPHHRASRFDKIAERATKITSQAPFFAICALLVILWLPTLFISVQSSQLWLQTATSIVTFLLVALLENSSRRNEEAVNLKLNAIAQGVADLMRSHTGDDSDLHDNIERLTQTVGLEERVTTVRHNDASDTDDEAPDAA